MDDDLFNEIAEVTHTDEMIFGFDEDELYMYGEDMDDENIYDSAVHTFGHSIVDNNIIIGSDYKNDCQPNKKKHINNYSVNLESIDIDPKVRNVDICCLCGHRRNAHVQLHKFFPCYQEYRCKKCGKFFFQHDHLKQPCFTPFKQLRG